MLLKELRARALVASFSGLGRLHGPSSSCGMPCLPPWRPQCRWQLTHHMQLRFKLSFLQLTPFRWLDEALASLRWGLGADCSRSSLLVCCFSILKWLEKMGQCFRKTPLFKNCRSERLSLLFISKIEIYNHLSALLLTLVCHFYHVLLRVAIFVLNVAIATYF